MRGFHTAFPEIVRKRIQLMGPSLDDFRPNYELPGKILETLEKMGFEGIGVAGDRLDLKNMPDETKLMLDKTITSIRTAKLVRKSRADDSLEEFKCYKLKSHKVMRDGVKSKVYSLVDMVPEHLLHNDMYLAIWLEGHCKAVNKFVGHGHDERALIKSQLPMMEMDLEPLRLCRSRVAVSGRGMGFRCMSMGQLSGRESFCL